ncbi:hypothetical protein Q8F55_002490 [Vanrija albida]|uniref:Terminase small subunit n=1 Tax=Vanrija albida TaxID=181172 RepID=A0ABR3Q9Y7_9TREE
MKYESDDEDFPEVVVKQSESMAVIAQIIKFVKDNPEAFMQSMPRDNRDDKLAKLDQILFDLAEKFHLSPDLVRPGEMHRRNKRNDVRMEDRMRRAFEEGALLAGAPKGKEPSEDD